MLGVSIEELGREQALVKTVAKLLGVKFDRLWDRHRRRQRRNRLLGGATAAVLLLAVLLGVLAYWDYSRLKTAYYADYVETLGCAARAVPPHGETGRTATIVLARREPAISRATRDQCELRRSTTGRWGR